MGDTIVITGLVFVLIVIGAVVFIGWMSFRVLAFVLRGLFGSPGKTQAKLPTSAIRCPREKCRADNPANANFCRRCGVRLKAAQPALPRQAAMW